jgi:hypothetical protein
MNRQQRQSLRDYCRACSDRQLRNILADERDRLKRYTDENVRDEDTEAFVEEAEREMERRGLEVSE